MSEARALSRRHWPFAAACVAIYAAAIAVAPPRAAAVGAAAAVLAPLAVWLLVEPGRWLVAFLLCALLLPPLPVAMGNTGPHVAMAAALLGLYAGLLRAREWRIRAGGLTTAWVAYFFILLASLAPAVWYSGGEIAAAAAARVLLFGISVYVFFYTSSGPWVLGPESATRCMRVFFFAGIGTALFACLDFYFQFPAPAGFGPQFVWLSVGVLRRAQGVFYEASTLGNVCAFFLIVALVAFLRRSRQTGLSRPVLMAGAALFCAALMFSYSRGSVLNVAAAVAALLYLRRPTLRQVRLLAVSALAVCAAAAIVYWIYPRFFEAYVWRWRGSAEFLADAPGKILSGRLDNWRLLGGFAMQHPAALLVGVGYKTLPYTSIMGRPVVADNMYLDVLLETGIAGLAALLFLNVCILRAGLRAARHPNAQTSFFGTVIFCFWIGQIVQMASGDLLTYWRVVPLYAWTLGVAVRLSAEPHA